MAGSKGKNVPTPRSRKEQDADKAQKTHVSDWKKVGSITKSGQTMTSYSCKSCGILRLSFGTNEPPDEVHKDRK